MQQDGIFKTTSFGGFDKKSVLTYIDNLTERFRITEQEYQKQLEGFSKAQESQVSYIQKMETQVSELEEQIEQLTEQLAHTPSQPAVVEVSSSPAELQEASEKIASLEEICRQKTQELELLQEAGRQQQFKIEAMEFKSRKYDEISGEVGEALLAARQTAEQITRQAQKDAEQAKNQAMQEAQAHKEKIEKEAARCKEQAEQEAAQRKEQAERESEQLLTQARHDATLLTAKARQESEQTLTSARETAAELVRDAESRLKYFGGEFKCFQSDTTRMRKTVEEILFVLNDRLDVMQEIVSAVDERYVSASAETTQKPHADHPQAFAPKDPAALSAEQPVPAPLSPPAADPAPDLLEDESEIPAHPPISMRHDFSPEDFSLEEPAQKTQEPLQTDAPIPLLDLSSHDVTPLESWPLELSPLSSTLDDPAAADKEKAHPANDSDDDDLELFDDVIYDLDEDL